jgi:DNA primase
LSFHEAILTLAERFNIPIRYSDGAGPSEESRSLRRQLLEIHEQACDYYHRAFLAEHPLAAAVRAYWQEQRGFSLELARALRIGFAPPGGHKLNQLLIDKGFSDDAVRQSGLFYGGERPQPVARLQARFRGRLMIPIRDLQGQVIAFTARQLDVTPADDPAREAKYINSPETPVFHKGRILFNLDRAWETARATHGFLLVEGQLDALRCWDCGFTETVAPQGTAVTEEQMRLLRRYAERVEVLLDGDSAGRAAALRILPLALRVGLEASFLVLPDGMDPDTFLRRHGPQAMAGLRQQAEPAMAFAARSLLPAGEASPQQRARSMEQLFSLISECDSAIARAEYLEAAIAATGVDTQAARSDFARWERRRARAGAPAGRAAQTAPNQAPAAKSANKLTSVETDLLWIVLQDVQWAQALAQVMDHDWIDADSVAGKVLARILAEAQAGTWDGAAHADVLLETQEERDCFYSVYAAEPQFSDIAQTASHSLQTLALRSLKQQLASIDHTIIAHTGDAASLRALREQRRDLNSLRLRVRAQAPTVSLPGLAT